MKNVYSYRIPRASEAKILTELALISKSHWGYPKEWIELWKGELLVTSELIQNSIGFVAEYQGQIVGFWCRSPIESEEPTPGRLFIHPNHIGKGIGRELWSLIKTEAMKRGIRSFTLEADPNAAAFYIKMGAKKVGEKESQVVPGRKIPILRFELELDKSVAE